MPDPEIGKTNFNKRLDGIRDQFGTIMEVFQDMSENDPGPQEKLALLMTGMQAVIKGMDDVIALERFGAAFKQTGQLDPSILEKGKK